MKEQIVAEVRAAVGTSRLRVQVKPQPGPESTFISLVVRIIFFRE
jgi:hypothetical protein